MKQDDEILPVCRICGYPISDGSEMVREDRENTDEPAYLCHRSCREQTDGAATG